MPQTEIRLIPAKQCLEIVQPLLAYAFSASPPLNPPQESAEAFASRSDAEYLVLFEDDQPTVTACSTGTGHNLRGKIVDASCVWGVSATPRVRRRGYVRQIVTRLLEHTRSLGQPVSLLYPFRESFYERLGYVSYPQRHNATFHVSQLRPIMAMDLPGEVTVYTAEEGVTHYRDFLLAYQQDCHGMVVFSEKMYQWAFKDEPRWIAIAYVDDTPMATMVYSLKTHGGAMSVDRFYYHTSAGKYLLLEWLARHVDQVGEVTLANLHPKENVSLWISDLSVERKALKAPMARVVDIEALSGIGAGDGRFTAQVNDPECPWNNGTFMFEGSNGTLTVTKTDAAPDCTLSIQGLTALVYGTHTPEDFAYRGWGNMTTSVQQTALAVFPPMQPHMHEQF